MSKNPLPNHNSDSPQPIDKRAVQKLIDEQIKKLESYETKIMRQDIFNDEEELIEEDSLRFDHIFSSSHFSTTTAIMELKLLSNKIKAL